MSGILASFLQALAFPDAPLYIYFPIIAGIGLLMAVVVSYLTPPTNEDVLVNFYMTVQPAGIWEPVVSLVRQRHPGFAKERPFRYDLLNVVLGIPWLFSLWVFPMYLVGQRYEETLIYFCVTAVLSVVLYFTWYKPLKKVKSR